MARPARTRAPRGDRRPTPTPPAARLDPADLTPGRAGPGARDGVEAKNQETPESSAAGPPLGGPSPPDRSPTCRAPPPP
ncbi:MAG: hypothetical protein ACK559_29650, partial [bacterium]